MQLNKGDLILSGGGGTSLNNKYEKLQIYQLVGSGTTGGLVLPKTGGGEIDITKYIIQMDQYSGGVDALCVKTSGGFPIDEIAKTASGTPIICSLSGTGNSTYTFSGEPSGYPVAVIFIVLMSIVDSQYVDVNYILNRESIAPVQSVFNRVGDIVAATGDYTADQVTNAVTTSQTTAQAIGSATNRIFKSWHTDIDANKIITSKIIPQADGTSAIVFYKANGTTAVMTIDSTNSTVTVTNFEANGYISGGTRIQTPIIHGLANAALTILSRTANFPIIFGNGNGGTTLSTEFGRFTGSGDFNHVAGKYNYQAASPTADTKNDTRISNQSGIIIWEIAIANNATKGAVGNWTETYRIDTNGFQTAQYDDVLPVNDWANASGGAAPDTVSHTIGGIVVNLKCFDGNNTEEAMVNFFEITHAIDIDALNRSTAPLLAEIHTHGLPSTNAAGVVKIFYDLVYMPAPVGGVSSAPIVWGTFSNLITVNLNEQYHHKLGGVELTKPTSGFNIGDKILVKYRRTPTDAQDTYTDDWIFSQCALHMPLNSNGSRQRYVK